MEKFEAANLFTRGLYAIDVQPGQMGDWVRRGPLAYRHGEVIIRRRYTGFMMMRQVFERVCSGCDRDPGPSERTCRACGGRIQDRMQDHKRQRTSVRRNRWSCRPSAPVRWKWASIQPSTERPTAVAHTLKHLLQKVTPERVACDEGDLAGAFREGRDTYFFLYDDWLGGLGVSRRAFESMDDLLARAWQLTAKTCCTSPSGLLRVHRGLPLLLPRSCPAESAVPPTRPATHALLRDRAGRGKPRRHVPDAVPLPDAVPALPAAWPLQARELLDLHGLSLPEVSARLGIPSRELQRAVSGTEPLRLQSSPNLATACSWAALHQGDRREVLVVFPRRGPEEAPAGLRGPDGGAGASGACWTHRTGLQAPLS